MSPNNVLVSCDPNKALSAAEGKGLVVTTTYAALSEERWELSLLLTRNPSVIVVNDCPPRQYALEFMKFLSSATQFACDVPGRPITAKKAPKFIFVISDASRVKEWPVTWV